MILKSCYHSKNKDVVGYTNTDRYDFLLLLATDHPGSLPKSLTVRELLKLWNTAPPRGDGQKGRSVHFFQGITNESAAKRSARQARLGADPDWGFFVYWDNLDAAKPIAHFPPKYGTSYTLVTASQWELRSSLFPPDYLDGLQFSCRDGVSFELRHVVKGKRPNDPLSYGHWELWKYLTPDASNLNAQRLFQADYIRLNFAPGPHLATGSLRCSVPGDQIDEFPIEIAYSGLTYTKNPSAFESEILLRGNPFTFSYDTGLAPEIALDPRDNARPATSAPNSHLYFPPDSILNTYYITDKGVSLSLTVPDNDETGFCRLQYQVDSASYDPASRTWMADSPRSKCYGRFNPEQDFVVSGPVFPQPRGRAKGSSVHRMLAGAAPTEFIELQVGDIFSFKTAAPAVLKMPTDPAWTIAPNLPTNIPPTPASFPLHSAGQLITTSWLTVKGGGTPPTVPGYYSEPAKSPLFSPPNSKAKSPASLLGRRYLNFGDFSTHPYIPVLPWAGSPIAQVKSSLDYETSHLSISRRAIIPRKLVAARKKKSIRDANSLSVTPQGIVASTDAAGNFTTLYFGDPNISSSGVALEFALTIKAAPNQLDFHQELQRSLRSDNLFLPFYYPNDHTLDVISPSANITFDQFSFDVTIQTKPSKATTIYPSVLLVKYYRGQSLQSLVANPNLWACSSFLAPDTDAAKAGIQYLADPDDPTLDKEDQDAWRSVWTDPDWQGVVMLNFVPGTLKGLLQALGAGMDWSHFRVHHFGLNFLPVASSDLSKPTPARFGSAFGLLHYDPQGAQLPTINSDESYEPLDPTATPTKVTYSYVVQKLDIAIQNSQISRFDAKVDMGFSHLFWDSVQPDANKKPHSRATGTKTIRLIGSYESRDGSQDSQKIFRLVTDKDQAIDFDPTQSFIKTLNIAQAELTVTSTNEQTQEIVFFIGIKGDLIFNDNAGPQKYFHNIAHVEKIHMERFGLEVDYKPNPSATVYSRFRADGLRVDVTIGDGKNTLFSILPLAVKGFRVAVGNPFNLLDMGYLSLPLPENGHKAETFDFAFDLELDLGFLGGLSGTDGSLKLPLLLGWRKNKANALGDYGFGIQFPNYKGTDFQIGIQQFIAIHAQSAIFKVCQGASGPVAQAIVLHDVKLLLFGQKWPTDDGVYSLALFIPTTGQAKMSWIFGRTGKDTDFLPYLGLGQRVNPPGNNDGSAKSILNSLKNTLELKPQPGTPANPNPDPDAGVCGLLPLVAQARDGWLIGAEIQYDPLFHAWLVLDDAVPLYALQLTFLGLFGLGASYRKINDTLGQYSAEVSLSSSLPPLNFGAVSARAPTVRVDVYTDGGWLLDIGFPWNNDFRRSFQMEMGIFLGSAGVYFGATSAIATQSLQLQQESYGFKTIDQYPQPTNPVPAGQKDLSKLRALRAGMAFRIGIGRSLDLGVLTGEASVCIYGSLEGAAVFSNGLTADLFSIRGVIGIMVQITAKLDFIVLQASAELCAFVQVELEIAKVLAYNPADKQYYAVSLPFTVTAEVGIYLHFELWVTIGCVRVKVCDLNFSATWKVDEQLGDYSAQPLTDSAKAATAELPMPETRPRSAMWSPVYLSDAAAITPETLPLYVTTMPCAGNAEDFGGAQGTYVPCVIGQILLEMKEFIILGKFLVTRALNISTNPNNPPYQYPIDDQTAIDRNRVIAARKNVRKGDYWQGVNGDGTITAILQAFSASVKKAPQPPDTDTMSFCAVPAWPGVSWQLGSSLSQPAETVRSRNTTSSAPLVGYSDDFAFLDFIRLMTESLLREIDRLIKLTNDANPPAKGGQSVNPSMNWGDIWKGLKKTDAAATAQKKRRRQRANHRRNKLK